MHFIYIIRKYIQTKIVWIKQQDSFYQTGTIFGNAKACQNVEWAVSKDDNGAPKTGVLKNGIEK